MRDPSPHKNRVGRRTRGEIVGEILSISMGRVSKTTIVYRANLNFTRAQRYIDRLLGDGLLRTVEGSTGYETTERGMEFLRLLNSIRELSDL